ncbi:unnamed protein product [Linum trigynum]|uniref:Uncharacterized protein n=1 Tax=Linum trigynum TaxID=586398 RepID=A0AAV2CBJ4_9ROSI
MSSPPSNLVLNPTFTEQEWLKQIDQAIQLGPETITKNLSSIFRVPATISVAKPQSYAPKLVGLGPLHHFQRRLYQNEPLKLAGAEQALKRFNVATAADFPNLVRQIVPLLPAIRLCYDSHLDIADDTLAWVLAIDGLFVAEMLYNPQFLLPRTSSSFSFSEKLRDITGDIVLLENQVPIYTLFPAEISVDLCKMLESFCRVLSPFKLQDSDSDVELKPAPKHLLDHVYQLITREKNRAALLRREESDVSSPADEDSVIAIGGLGTLADDLAEKVGDASEDIGPVQNVTAGIERLAQIQIRSPISSIFRILDILGISSFVNEALEDEITLLPSAGDLKGAGVKFAATTGGLRCIEFDESDAVLTLPAFSWKPSSEIVIRNLVAYESLAKPDSAILTRYTEMMHAMVQDKKDAKLLREDGIVEGNNAAAGDEAMVALFGGMGRSPDPMSRTVLDKPILEVNSYYNRKSKVVASKVFKLGVKALLRVLMVVAAIALLVMFSIQSYCSIYVCAGTTGGGLFGIGTLESPVGRQIGGGGGMSSLLSSV